MDRHGEEAIVTEQGRPEYLIPAGDSAVLLDYLTRAGVLGAPGRTERPNAREASRVPAREPVSELVRE